MAEWDKDKAARALFGAPAEPTKPTPQQDVTTLRPKDTRSTETGELKEYDSSRDSVSGGRLQYVDTARGSTPVMVTGIQNFRLNVPKPVIPEPVAPEPVAPETQHGTFKDIWTGFGRGGGKAAELLGRGLQVVDFDPVDDEGFLDTVGQKIQHVGEKISGLDVFKADTERQKGEEGFLKRTATTAAESTPLSAIPWAAGAATGAAYGALGGPGGAMVGGVVGGAAALALTFFGGTFHESKEKATKHYKLHNPEMSEEEIYEKSTNYGLTNATFEAGTELAGDIAALATFGFGKMLFGWGKAGTKATLASTLAIGPKEFVKTAAKGFASQVPFEAGSEMVAYYGQSKADKEFLGIGSGATLMGYAEAAATAFWMSGGMSIAAQGMNTHQANKLTDRLNNTENQGDRVKAAVEISKRIKKNSEKGSNVPEQWLEQAIIDITAGKHINLSRQIIDFSTEGVQHQQSTDDKGRGVPEGGETWYSSEDLAAVMVSPEPDTFGMDEREAREFTRLSNVKEENLTPEEQAWLNSIQNRQGIASEETGFAGYQPEVPTTPMQQRKEFAGTQYAEKDIKRQQQASDYVKWGSQTPEAGKSALEQAGKTEVERRADKQADLEEVFRSLPFEPIGEPSTAKEAAELFSEQPYSMLEQTINHRRKIAEAFEGGLIPHELRTPLGQMMSDMERGEVGSRFQKDDGTWDDVKSTNPDWMKVQGGNPVLSKAGKQQIQRVVKKVNAGEKLFPGQQDIWDALKSEARNLENTNEEFANDVENQRKYEQYEKEGFVIGADQSTFAGNISKGDELIVVDRNGQLQRVTAIGVGKNGKVIFRNGKDFALDQWDQVTFVARQEGTGQARVDQWTKEAQDRVLSEKSDKQRKEPSTAARKKADNLQKAAAVARVTDKQPIERKKQSQRAKSITKRIARRVKAAKKKARIAAKIASTKKRNSEKDKKNRKLLREYKRAQNVAEEQQEKADKLEAELRSLGSQPMAGAAMVDPKSTAEEEKSAPSGVTETGNGMPTQQEVEQWEKDNQSRLAAAPDRSNLTPKQQEVMEYLDFGHTYGDLDGVKMVDTFEGETSARVVFHLEKMGLIQWLPGFENYSSSYLVERDNMVAASDRILADKEQKRLDRVAKNKAELLKQKNEAEGTLNALEASGEEPGAWLPKIKKQIAEAETVIQELRTDKASIKIIQAKQEKLYSLIDELETNLEREIKEAAAKNNIDVVALRGDLADIPTIRRRIESYGDPVNFQSERRDPSAYKQLSDISEGMPEGTEDLMTYAAEATREVKEGTLSDQESKKQLSELFNDEKQEGIKTRKRSRNKVKYDQKFIEVVVNGEKYIVFEPVLGVPQHVTTSKGNTALNKLHDEWLKSGKLAYSEEGASRGVIFNMQAFKPKSHTTPINNKTLEEAAIEQVKIQLELISAKIRQDAARVAITEQILPKIGDFEGRDHTWTDKGKDVVFWVSRRGKKADFSEATGQEDYLAAQKEIKDLPGMTKDKPGKMGSAGVTAASVLGKGTSAVLTSAEISKANAMLGEGQHEAGIEAGIEAEIEAGIEAELDSTSEADLDDMLDDVFGKKEPAPKKKPIKRGEPKKASTIVKEGGVSAVKGVQEALVGLVKLFGDQTGAVGKDLKTRAVNEKLYDEAKIHFVKAWEHAKGAGFSLKELMQHIADTFGKNVQPYLRRFLLDVKAGNLDTITAAEPKAEQQAEPKKAEYKPAYETIDTYQLKAPFKLVNIKDTFGTNVRVNEVDFLPPGREIIPTYNTKGELTGHSIHKENLDPDGTKVKAKYAGHLLFDGRDGKGYKHKSGARRAVTVKGQPVSAYNLIEREDGKWVAMHKDVPTEKAQEVVEAETNEREISVVEPNGVNTRLVVIEKPEKAEKTQSKQEAKEETAKEEAIGSIPDTAKTVFLEDKSNLQDDVAKKDFIKVIDELIKDAPAPTPLPAFENTRKVFFPTKQRSEDSWKIVDFDKKYRLAKSPTTGRWQLQEAVYSKRIDRNEWKQVYGVDPNYDLRILKHNVENYLLGRDFPEGNIVVKNKAKTYSFTVENSVAALENLRKKVVKSEGSIGVKFSKSTQSLPANQQANITQELEQALGQRGVENLIRKGLLKIVSPAQADSIIAGFNVGKVKLSINDTEYHRLTNNDSPMSDWGHAMFAKDIDSIDGYGEEHYTIKKDAPEERTIYAGSDEFRNELKEMYEEGPGRHILDSMVDSGFNESDAIDRLLDEANPDDIVDTAELWDDESMSLVWEFILEPNGWDIVETMDGAIVFDEKLIQKEPEIRYAEDGSGRVEGFVLPGSDTVHLVQGNIPKGQSYATMLHETGHALLPKVFTGKAWDRLTKVFDNHSTNNTPTGKAIQRAKDLVPAGTNPDHVAEEEICYFLTTESNKDLSLYKRIMGYIRMTLVKLGVPANILHPDDIVSMVKGHLDYLSRPDKPITRNDQGQVIPLSERFQDTQDDIRFSVGAGREYKSQDDYAENRKQAGNLKEKTTRTVKGILRDAAEGTDKFLGAISTRLKNIHQKLQAKIRRLDHNIAKGSYQDIDAMKPLLEKAKKEMSRDDFKDWDYARKNNDKPKIAQLVKDYGMEKEYATYQERIEQLYQEAEEVGLAAPENYHPRILKDHKGFLEQIKVAHPIPNLTMAIEKRAIEMGFGSAANLSDQVKGDIISNILYGGQYGLGGKVRDLFAGDIPPDLNKYFMESDGALMATIHSLRKTIEQRKFFGKVPKNISQYKANLSRSVKELNAEKGKKEPDQDRIKTLQDNISIYEDKINLYAYSSGDYNENIGQFVNELISNGEINDSDQQKLTEILNARFDEKGTRGLIQAYKNFSYIDTMGNPLSALTQIGDLAWAAYYGGIGPAMKNAYKSATKQSRITKEDIYITRMAQEFADTDTLSNAVNTVFKMVGLEKMDSIGKESFLNAALEKFEKRAVKDPAGLAEEIKVIFEGETADVVADLQNKDITDNVKLLVYSKLLDFQPVALSEMSEMYLLSGNGRIFFMLKSYTLKQFDVFRREVYTGLKSGDKKQVTQAMKNLVMLSMFLMLANAGADELKDWMLDRDTDLQDRVVDNILRLFGISKFITWKGRTEGYGSAMAKQILPPMKFVDSATRDIVTAGDEKGMYLTKSVPVVGKLYYWHMGRGQHSRTDLWDRRFSKKHKALKNIQEKVEKNPKKRGKYRKEIRQLARMNKYRTALNRNRRQTNLLLARQKKTGKQYGAGRIERLQQRRVIMIKRYLDAI